MTSSSSDGRLDSRPIIDGKVDCERPAFITPVLGLLLPVLFNPVEPPAAHQNSLGFLTVASPELPVTWQFSCCTALPPRAPSFVF